MLHDACVHAGIEIRVGKCSLYDTEHIVVSSLTIKFRSNISQRTQLVERYRREIMMFRMIIRSKRE